VAAGLRVSKSQYLAGVQCLRRLWWERYDRGAPELAPDEASRWLFEQGQAAGLLARRYVPHGEFERRVNTPHALASIDIVEPLALGHVLIEVKAAVRVKPTHLEDVAFQWHVAHASGLPVTRAEVMHFNPACRHPDLNDLFVRADVTSQIETMAGAVPGRIAAQREALAGQLPAVAPGPHCTDPRPCPFFDRCNPAPPDDDLRHLHQIRSNRLAELRNRGIPGISGIPEDEPLSPVQRRQRAAHRGAGLLVADGLASRLAPLQGHLAYLDFETFNPAVPAFAGSGPWASIPALFSMHRRDPDGGLSHHGWLAESGGDPRPALAAALVVAAAGADHVIGYNTSFESACLSHLAEAAPEHRSGLEAIRDRLVDLLPIIRDHVYHPAFRGGFGLKRVLPVLAPDMDHGHLVGVRDAGHASAVLGWLVTDPGRWPEPERARRRDQLLDYCRLDTLALVRLLDRLRALVHVPGRVK
jgi:uncharacterized protein DUF2779